MSKPIPILFVHYGHTEWIRGSERCLIDLIHHLDLTQYTPILWCDTQIMAQQFDDINVLYWSKKMCEISCKYKDRLASNVYPH